MRGPLKKKNQSVLYVASPTRELALLTKEPSRYYSLSVILGFGALTYAAVPFYKMVWIPADSCFLHAPIESNHGPAIFNLYL